MRLTTTRVLVAGALLALLGLAACGGGDDHPSVAVAPTSDVPDSAQQSPGGLIAYLNDLIKNHTDGTSEPVLVGDAKVPTDDTSEPTPLN